MFEEFFSEGRGVRNYYSSGMFQCEADNLRREKVARTREKKLIQEHMCMQCKGIGERRVQKIAKEYYGSMIEQYELLLLVCDVCKGWGVETKKCRVCGGTTLVRVYNMEETGKINRVQCSECKGNGKLNPCKHCGEGDTCWVCKGTGTLDMMPCKRCVLGGRSRGVVPVCEELVKKIRRERTSADKYGNPI